LKQLAFFYGCMTLIVGVYEQWAKNAGWWYHHNTPMLGNTPWYIIDGEFLIALCLPAAIRC
jgi:hypothetical protein